MSNMQQARDVLAKWRRGSLPGLWSKEPNVDYEGTAQAAITTNNGSLTWDDHNGEVFSPQTAALIVGTAGNPDLWDAIDAMLALGVKYDTMHPWGRAAWRIAAAIIAADERMTS